MGKHIFIARAVYQKSSLSVMENLINNLKDSNRLNLFAQKTRNSLICVDAKETRLKQVLYVTAHIKTSTGNFNIENSICGNINKIVF